MCTHVCRHHYTSGRKANGHRSAGINYRRREREWIRKSQTIPFFIPGICQSGRHTHTRTSVRKRKKRSGEFRFANDAEKKKENRSFAPALIDSGAHLQFLMRRRRLFATAECRIRTFSMSFGKKKKKKVLCCRRRFLYTPESTPIFEGKEEKKRGNSPVWLETPRTPSSSSFHRSVNNWRRSSHPISAVGAN